jgi:RNA polymerase sigma factor (sigma-70 family)
MLTDRPTLERFRAGDREVLGEVYRTFAPDIGKMARFGFSFRSGTEVHRFYGFTQAFEQQDLVQEVFIRAFSESARMSYDGLTPYESYLKGILRNLVIDEARRRRAALNAFGGPGGSQVSEEHLERAPSADDNPEVATHNKRVRDAMAGFVETLPVREQRLVQLRWIEGKNQDEVAKKMKVSRQTVRTLEGRVRKRLHKHLRTRGVLEGGLSTKGMGALAAMPSLIAPLLGVVALVVDVLLGGSHV